MNYLKIKISNTVTVLKAEHIEYNQYKGIVYIDRDGVLIEDFGYVGSVENVQLIPGAISFLKLCKKSKYLIAIITNQSGIGRGYYSWDDYYLVTNEMLHKLGGDIYPHFVMACSDNPEDQSKKENYYRKPRIGMIEYIRAQVGPRFKTEILIGDKASDINCGLKANIKFISHVLTGHGKAEQKKVEVLTKMHPQIKIYESIGDILPN